jgi:hypothetical protein
MTHPKRPRDPNQLANSISEIAGLAIATEGPLRWDPLSLPASLVGSLRQLDPLARDP